MYYRFSLGFRDVEELMAERGVIVINETIRAWAEKFGRRYAKRLRHRAAHAGDQWYLDEVFIRINSKQHILWGGCGSRPRRSGYPGSSTPQYESG